MLFDWSSTIAIAAVGRAIVFACSVIGNVSPVSSRRTVASAVAASPSAVPV